MPTGKLVVAVTGASGAIYAQRFVRKAAQQFSEIYLMLSEQAVLRLRTLIERAGLPVQRLRLLFKFRTRDEIVFGERRGYIKLALKTGVPISPVS